VISPEWHPDDERLLSRYLDPREVDPSLERHLGSCASCATRYSSLAEQLDGWHQDAQSAIDAIFTNPRLEAQRRAVQARLGGQPSARVIPFPLAARTPPRTRLWTRVAVAAALVVVTSAGVLRVAIDRPASHSIAIARGHAAAAPRPYSTTRVSQDAVFEDIELALARPRTAELRALDDLTPEAAAHAQPLR
jgi:hypothetical protein